RGPRRAAGASSSAAHRSAPPHHEGPRGRRGGRPQGGRLRRRRMSRVRHRDGVAGDPTSSLEQRLGGALGLTAAEVVALAILLLGAVAATGVLWWTGRPQPAVAPVVIAATATPNPAPT